MTRDPLEIIRRGCDLMWRDGDFDAATALLDDDFEWVVPGFADGEVRYGREGVLSFFREFLEPWESYEVEYEITDEGAGRVLAVTTMTARGRASGVTVELRMGQVWESEAGRLVRMTLYGDVDEARAALARTRVDRTETFEGEPP